MLSNSLIYRMQLTSSSDLLLNSIRVDIKHGTFIIFRSLLRSLYSYRGMSTAKLMIEVQSIVTDMSFVFQDALVS